MKLKDGFITHEGAGEHITVTKDVASVLVKLRGIGAVEE